jgi:copper oxidase (laccase) domain-containing protein
MQEKVSGEEKATQAEEFLTENELIEREKLIKEEEELLKQEKEKLIKTINELNIKKLKDMGLDVVENKIRCSICKDWKPLSKRKFLRREPKTIIGNMIKKHGVDIIWTYKCKECKKKIKKKT